MQQLPTSQPHRDLYRRAHGGEVVEGRDRVVGDAADRRTELGADVDDCQDPKLATVEH